MFRTTTIRPDYSLSNPSSIGGSESAAAVEENSTIKRKAKEEPFSAQKKLKNTYLFRAKTFPQESSATKPLVVAGGMQSEPLDKTEDAFGLSADKNHRIVIPWRKSIPTAEEAQEERISNTALALLQHKRKERLESGEISIYPENVDLVAQTVNIRLRGHMAELQGMRETMEDASLFAKLKEGYIIGVFDGHGGDGVAKAAKESFPHLFSEALRQTNFNEHIALEATLAQIQKEVVANPRNRLMGSTAEVSFIRKDGKIFNATLGDGKTFIFRENGQVVPLSVTRDWSDPKEAARAIRLAKTPADAEKRAKWIGHPNPKQLRVHNGKGATINISNALGDPTYLELTHKPTITEGRLLPGDRVVTACDGFWDYVEPKEVRVLLQTAKQRKNLAERLVNYAMFSKTSKDNISVIVTKVKSSG